jgi:hypothetical protein
MPPPPPAGENPFHDDPSVPPTPKKLMPPMPPPLESELPQSSLPKPLRSAGRAPAVIRTATHVEMSIDDDSAPRLLTPPAAAAPVSRSAGPLPQIITPAATLPQIVAPARKLPEPDQPARPISGNSLRFRLLK